MFVVDYTIKHDPIYDTASRVPSAMVSELRECHKPGLDLQTTVPWKCPSSPEDEQGKQGQVRTLCCIQVVSRRISQSKSHFSSIEGMNFRMAQDRGTGVREVTTPIPSSSSAASFPSRRTCNGTH
ncbi:hypothetical protein TNCV_4953871 [Trichonephila clavipes]|nr:hypothetical protein TNCV_4953871 [Trichonephila clavipes]